MLCYVRYLHFKEATASILRIGSSILKMLGTGSSKMLEPTLKLRTTSCPRTHTHYYYNRKSYKNNSLLQKIKEQW